MGRGSLRSSGRRDIHGRRIRHWENNRRSSISDAMNTNILIIQHSDNDNGGRNKRKREKSTKKTKNKKNRNIFTLQHPDDDDEKIEI